MGVFAAISGEAHEQVVYGYDPVSGLQTIIAIHSTALGPALGGTRFFAYDTEEAALEDVLRLSRAMSRKAAVARLDLGGGKAVIIGDPTELKSERLWRAYGRVIDSLGGRYITAEDVGTDSDDMELIRRETRWVTGIPAEEGGSGDPSPATARGMTAAMRAVARHLWGSEDLSGRRIAIQGVGKVGYYLVEDLTQAGAEVVVADIFEPAVQRVVEEFGAKSVDPEEILVVDCDILAPCAMGSVLNTETIPKLGCRAIAGSANNQLAADEDAELLHEAGVLFAPDFVVNAGGLINVAEELRGYAVDRAIRNIEKLYDRTLDILTAADKRGVSPYRAAIEIADNRISQIGDLRRFRRSSDERT